MALVFIGLNRNGLLYVENYTKHGSGAFSSAISIISQEQINKYVVISKCILIHFNILCSDSDLPTLYKSFKFSNRKNENTLAELMRHY